MSVLILRHTPWYEPTPAQKRTGNYRKRRVEWFGCELVVENEAGSVRTFINPDGSVGEKRLIYPYGYLAGTVGADGDEIDVFLGPSIYAAQFVYVVRANTKGKWSKYDEDKVMLGFASIDDAELAFLRNYDDERFLGEIETMPVASFVRAALKTAGKRPARLVIRPGG